MTRPLTSDEAVARASVISTHSHLASVDATPTDVRTPYLVAMGDLATAAFGARVEPVGEPIDLDLYRYADDGGVWVESDAGMGE